MSKTTTDASRAQSKLTYTPVSNAREGHRTFNTLKRLITEVRQWARDTGNTELDAAMKDAYGLAVTGWTEVDESLSRLNSTRHNIKKRKQEDAIIDLDWAMKYLNRWQDRDGTVGNVECVTEEDLTDFILPDGSTLPASFASAKIERIEKDGIRMDSLRIIKCIFGTSAKLIISPHMINTDALRKVWPQLVDKLIAEPKGIIKGQPVTSGLTTRAGVLSPNS
jgi:hypothetical protein